MQGGVLSALAVARTDDVCSICGVEGSQGHSLVNATKYAIVKARTQGSKQASPAATTRLAHCKMESSALHAVSSPSSVPCETEEEAGKHFSGEWELGKASLWLFNN